MPPPLVVATAGALVTAAIAYLLAGRLYIEYNTAVQTGIAPRSPSGEGVEPSLAATVRGSNTAATTTQLEASVAALGQTCKSGPCPLGTPPAYSRAQPGSWAGKEDGHTPVAAWAGAVVTVSVPHTQSPAHHIGAIWLREVATGAVVALQRLATDAAPAPQRAVFTLPPGVGAVVPYAWCNLHGVWLGDAAEPAAPVGPPRPSTTDEDGDNIETIPMTAAGVAGTTAASTLSHTGDLLGQKLKFTLSWYAPFFSHSGYGSEAWAFVDSLRGLVDIKVTQHGDTPSDDIVESMGQRMFADRKKLLETRADPERTVVVCHSEPGAWNPPNYETALCPPAEEPLYSIGRTMFETGTTRAATALAFLPSN